MDIVAQRSTKFNGNLKIDPEFRDKIPPMTEEQFKGLREDILRDGYVRDPLVVWKEENILLDGHHRWRIICENWETLSDKYTVDRKSFPNRWAALEWICRNQLNKHNLNDEQITYIRGEMYKARKKSESTRDERGRFSPSHLNEDAVKGPARTAKIIAKELGVGQSTIERAEKFHDGVDAIKEVSPEAADKVLQGKSGLTKTQVSEVPKMEPEKRREVVAAILSGQKPEAMKSKEPRQKKQGYGKETRAINDAMSKYSSASRETEPVAEYSVDDLYEEIVVNAKAYVDMLRNTLVIRHSVLDKDRDRIRKGVQDIIDAIVKVRNLI